MNFLLLTLLLAADEEKTTLRYLKPAGEKFVLESEITITKAKTTSLGWLPSSSHARRNTHEPRAFSSSSGVTNVCPDRSGALSPNWRLNSTASRPGLELS